MRGSMWDGPSSQWPLERSFPYMMRKSKRMHDAKFWPEIQTRTFRNTYDCDFLGAYDNKTLTLKLPGDLEATDVFWLSVFCIPYGISFAHVYLPYKDLNVPTSMDFQSVSDMSHGLRRIAHVSWYGFRYQDAGWNKHDKE